MLKFNVFKAFFACIIIFSISLGLSLNWLDKKSWNSPVDARLTLVFLSKTYLLSPFSSEDDDISRTLKIAHLLAISNLNKKKPSSLLVDMYNAEKIIGNFISKKTNLNDEAITELSLERLIISNRLKAILMIGRGKDQSIYNDSDVIKLAKTSKERSVGKEEWFALDREINLFDIQWQENRLMSNKNDIIYYVDMYYIGLIQCLFDNQDGASRIATAAKNIAKENLMYLAYRNADILLISKIISNKKSKCAEALLSNLNIDLK